ncbi:MAG TPA: hypothetical protein VN948_22970 [Terriglobales bacterium]|nr:hypothetical protein [Terriglobales bacterium]
MPSRRALLGVGVLALAQPSEAKIIYTAAHKTIRVHQHYNLDLNHDGITDFTLQIKTFRTRGTSAFSTLRRFSLKTTRLRERKPHSSGGPYAFALQSGASIGRKQPFPANLMARVGTIDDISFYVGQWLNAENRYLDLKFQIHGKTHFGWARVSVGSTKISITSATLTGYAYETIPGKSIIAGKTKGPDEIASGEQPSPASVTVPNPKPATLGMLAIGSSGLSIWQREELGAANPQDESRDPRRDDRHNAVAGQFLHEQIQEVRLHRL